MILDIGVWALPVIITAVSAGMMFRPPPLAYPYESANRIQWLVPIVAGWTGYGLFLWILE